MIAESTTPSEVLKSWRTVAGAGLAAAAIFFPLLLIFNPQSEFYFDWNNHTWQVGYIGEYLLQNGHLPLTFNTNQVVGMPFPVFYGFLFYPLLGLLSTVFGGDFLLRPVIVGVWVLQWITLYGAFRSLRQPRGPSAIATSLFLTSIYSLTTLYNRNAIPELIATGLCNVALFLWVQLLLEPAYARARRQLCMIFLCVLFFSGIHPITAVVGGFYVAVAGVALYFLLPERKFRFSRESLGLVVTLGVAYLLVLSPWIFAAAKFQSHLYITYVSGELPKTYGFETYLARLWPLPWDPRMSRMLAGQGVVETPYDDLQINIPLLLLTIFYGVRALGTKRERKPLWLAGIGAALALTAFFLSMEPELYRFVPPFLKKIQIAYRMIAYVNLSLLVALFGLMLLPARSESASARNLVFALCLALAGTAVGIKLKHAAYVETDHPHEILLVDSRENLVDLAKTFFGVYDYSTPFAYPAIPQGSRGITVQFPVARRTSFGETRPIEFSVPTEAFVVTNVQVFPWNRLWLDGNPLPREALFVKDTSFAARVPAGSHRLEYRFVPDPIWLILRKISQLALVATLLGLGADFWRRRSREPLAMARS